MFSNASNCVDEKVADKMLFRFVVILICFIIVGVTFGLWHTDDKIKKQTQNIWMDSQGLYMTKVTCNGQIFYCEHAEVMAGYPDRLVLYRGDDYLLLPDKIAVEIEK